MFRWSANKTPQKSIISSFGQSIRMFEESGMLAVEDHSRSISGRLGRRIDSLRTPPCTPIVGRAPCEGTRLVPKSGIGTPSLIIWIFPALACAVGAYTKFPFGCEIVITEADSSLASWINHCFAIVTSHYTFKCSLRIVQCVHQERILVDQSDSRWCDLANCCGSAGHHLARCIECKPKESQCLFCHRVRPSRNYVVDLCRLRGRYCWFQHGHDLCREHFSHFPFVFRLAPLKCWAFVFLPWEYLHLNLFLSVRLTLLTVNTNYEWAYQIPSSNILLDTAVIGGSVCIGAVIGLVLLGETMMSHGWSGVIMLFIGVGMVATDPGAKVDDSSSSHVAATKAAPPVVLWIAPALICASSYGTVLFASC